MKTYSEKDFPVFDNTAWVEWPNSEPFGIAESEFSETKRIIFGRGLFAWPVKEESGKILYQHLNPFF